DGPPQGWRRFRLVLPGHGPLATGAERTSSQMVRPSRRVDGEEPATGCTPLLPHRSRGLVGSEREERLTPEAPSAQSTNPLKCPSVQSARGLGGPLIYGKAAVGIRLAKASPARRSVCAPATGERKAGSGMLA